MKVENTSSTKEAVTRELVEAFAGVEDPGQHLVETGSLISFCN